MDQGNMKVVGGTASSSYRVFSSSTVMSRSPLIRRRNLEYGISVMGCTNSVSFGELRRNNPLTALKLLLTTWRVSFALKYFPMLVLSLLAFLIIHIGNS